MTDLAKRIAALTGADRAIDAEVADVLSWWPKNFRKPRDVGKAERFDMVRCDFCECPAFTASLDATLAEIKRRGWLYKMDNSLGSRGNYWLHFDLMTAEKLNVYAVERDDRDEALAAVEALVRAVEAGK